MGFLYYVPVQRKDSTMTVVGLLVLLVNCLCVVCAELKEREERGRRRRKGMVQNSLTARSDLKARRGPTARNDRTAENVPVVTDNILRGKQ